MQLYKPNKVWYNKYVLSYETVCSRREFFEMIYFVAACTVILIILQIRTLLLLKHQDKENIGELIHKALHHMQKEEQRFRQEQSAHTNETIRMGMDMMRESIENGQTQTRSTTSEQLRAFGDRIQALENANTRAMRMLQETIGDQMTALREQNEERLKEIQKTVDQTLTEHLEAKMTASFQRVTNSLEAVYRGLGEMKTLAADVGGLKRVLSNVKTRGNLGEIQLGAILAEILAPEQYDTNVETVPGSGKRVEYALKLPADDGKPVYLPIDSKFPADCYTHLLDAQESGERQVIDAAAAALRSRVFGFAKDIRDKYVHEPETTAFGIMFLPSEGLYAEVVSRGMTEELQQRYHISVAGPSTMAAMLNALYMGFRTLAIQKQSDHVWKILGGVKTEFEQFESVLEGTQNKLDAVGKELDKLVGVRTRAINRRLAQVQRLEMDDEE